MYYFKDQILMSNILSFSSVIHYTGYILLAIVVLLFMVMIHEFGHYIAGKILKFKINEFSVGFGPKIFQKTKKNGEKFTLRIFPLGGYCAFEGEDEQGNESKNAFNNQKPWKRLIVLFCGAFFNFLSAIIFSFILLLNNGYDLVQVSQVGNTSINYNYLQTGDVIYGIEGTKIDFVYDDYFNVLISESVEDIYASYDGAELAAEKDFSSEGKIYYYTERDLEFMVKREGKKAIVNGKVNVIYNEDGEYAGWSLYSSEQENALEFNAKSYKYSFTESLAEAVPFTFKWAWKILIVFGQLITGKLAITSLGGPVTTVKVIASSVQNSYLLVLLPVIAVNLAVFNLLPIPALDGCQMLFVIIEWIRKKPLNSKVTNAINNAGLIVLLGFVILVDILQFAL